MEEKIAVLYDVPESLRTDMTAELQKRNMTVYAKPVKEQGQVEDISHIDLLILGDGGFYEEDVESFQQEEYLRKTEQIYDRHVVKAMEMIHNNLSLMDRGAGRRICSLTTRMASNNQCFDTTRYGEHMARTARNMMMHVVQNELMEEGYTFRIFCHDGTAENAVIYFLQNRSIDSCPDHMDENRLVMRDGQGREIPW